MAVHKEKDLNTTLGVASPGVLFQITYGPKGLNSVADLQPGLSIEQLIESLDTLAESETVSHVDLTQALAEGEQCNLDKLICPILKLLQMETIKTLSVPPHILDQLTGKCKGYVIDALKRKWGERVQIGPLSVKVRDLVDISSLTIKMLGGNNVVPKELLTTMTVLEGVIKNPNQCPPLLKINILKVAKGLKKRKEIYKLNKERNISTKTRVLSRSIGNSCLDDIKSDPDLNQADFPPSARAASCYVCHEKYRHPQIPTSSSIQYPKMCQSCGQFNLMKRNQRFDLTGRIAVVTGGRIKIGFHTVVKLLRDNCKVIVTTRFPNDAAKRYSQENDYHQWAHNLVIYPLDFKDVNREFITRNIVFPFEVSHVVSILCKNFFISEIHKFVSYLEETIPYLDILINNAAQTIRRPREFYKHLIEYEQQSYHTLPSKQRSLLAVHGKLNYGSILSINMQSTDGNQTRKVSSSEEILDYDDLLKPSIKKRKLHHHTDIEGHTPPSVSSSLFSLNPSAMVTTEVEDFPEGKLDSDGQQVDLRKTNTWIEVLDDVPLSELVEVLMVNTVAPFILNKDLKSLLTKSPNKRRFIVNVSAMEGQFSRIHKTKYHPHTNMAKAALNMLTRTAALGYQEADIYMTSVDTGWVTDENPHQVAQCNQLMGFELPLDATDGAARVLDPIYSGITTNITPHYAVFQKDYHPHPW